MAGRESQPYVDNLKFFLAREFHGLRPVGDDGFRSGYESKNAFLVIESKSNAVFFGSSFMWFPFWFDW